MTNIANVLLVLLISHDMPAQVPARCGQADGIERGFADRGYLVRDIGVDSDGDTIRIYQHPSGRWHMVFLPAGQQGRVICYYMGGPILERQNALDGRPM